MYYRFGTIPWPKHSSIYGPVPNMHSMLHDEICVRVLALTYI